MFPRRAQKPSIKAFSFSARSPPSPDSNSRAFKEAEHASTADVVIPDDGDKEEMR
jgi:hypothetical protein